MQAEVILGFDPAPADPASLVSLSDVLRATVRALVEARSGIDRLGRAGSVWEGPAGAPLADLLRRFSGALEALEEALVDCIPAADAWRAGVLRRQAQVRDLVAAVADLPADGSGRERRTRLLAAAREVEQEHERGAGDLAAAFADLSAAVRHLVDPSADLAAELDRALLALGVALDDWIATEAPQLIQTAAALGDVAALTTVISGLVGVAALGRDPAETKAVREVVSKTPGSHRLIRALRRQWADLAPAALPEASFAGSSTQRPGGLARSLTDGESGSPQRAGIPGAGARSILDDEDSPC